MGKRPMSKKEVEEQRKKEQEQAAAQVSDAACNLTLSLGLASFAANKSFVLCAGV